ncbi:hypothetical protein K443DRAFT_5277 [Laccaria amethystina LaAM-08-1]|uniref:Uncharacterized protein n=1 Tax=Laccaria amethystina LaAM-08-1 TaxID=1095629 RepID=A0A0C9Y632_9AGAR|nr:hypothetical protein K443DRAFT_5277 [Laccaria amethystina LaAM-08-1]
MSVDVRCLVTTSLTATWHRITFACVPKYKTTMNDVRRSSSFGCHVAVSDVEPGSCGRE